SRRVLLPPMPPKPTVALLTVSLGAWNPLPSTCRGRMVTPAPAAAVGRNVRLETWLSEPPCRGRFYCRRLSLSARRTLRSDMPSSCRRRQSDESPDRRRGPPVRAAVVGTGAGGPAELGGGPP